MCDLGSIATTLQPSGGEFTFGELVKQGGAVASTYGESQAAADLERQRKNRINQIAESTRQTIELKAIEQGRRRGSMAAAIGKTGVAMSGSAEVLLQQQDRMDEIALETAKQRGIIEIGAEEQERKAANVAKKGAQSRAIAMGFDLAKNVKEGYL